GSSRRQPGLVVGRPGPDPRGLFHRPRPRPGLPRAGPAHARERNLRPTPDGRGRGNTPPGRRPGGGDPAARKHPLRDDDRRHRDPERRARRLPDAPGATLRRPPLRGPHLPAPQQGHGRIFHRQRDGQPLRRPDEPPLQGDLRSARPGLPPRRRLPAPPHRRAPKQGVPGRIV
ncbi:MAG: hypothetical protein AVDCRST_MAG02-2314, partial [uncultured Rubrobacteraceae bacterium]